LNWSFSDRFHTLKKQIKKNRICLPINDQLNKEKEQFTNELSDLKNQIKAQENVSKKSSTNNNQLSQENQTLKKQNHTCQTNQENQL
jgi:anion-transporting  ArsA/GET3 family ATPase